MPRDLPDAPPPRHQRAEGAFDLHLAAGPRGTALRDLYQQAPARVLFPVPEPDEALTAAVLNCAGGLAGGDSLRQSVRLEANARATLSTAAAEKVYRSLGPETRVESALQLGPGAVLEWIPQETILFDGARLRRRMVAHLAPGALLLAAETLVFGRAARGERMTSGMVFDAWRLEGPDGLLWMDALALEGDLAARLAAPFGFAGAEALGTLLLAGGAAEAARDVLRALPERAPGGATLPRPGLLLARWLGPAGAVREAVAAAILALRAAQLGLPPRLPRLWTT
ncbi:urease accessory protein UreD [Siccirubricoccus sp. KC 17139]|uniref:Urease accessory protein UreD n=1 Tax=Siccirubricoccus soli TaxID=2899147 RepID=A0ABT1DEH6_9PROT|nr:urease accessory protein UreD [Siccirubricoccus soli]MCO6419370.1 urease accessory protein UreD [Siccirubricoccus soli]MCP2685505.1 urease accessory protein UreD [Siccirubricoccus soli]